MPRPLTILATLSLLLAAVLSALCIRSIFVRETWGIYPPNRHAVFVYSGEGRLRVFYGDGQRMRHWDFGHFAGAAVAPSYNPPLLLVWSPGFVSIGHHVVVAIMLVLPGWLWWARRRKALAAGRGFEVETAGTA